MSISTTRPILDAACLALAWFRYVQHEWHGMLLREELREPLFSAPFPSSDAAAAKNLVERGELAMLFDRMPGRTAPFKDREDKFLEFPLELGFFKDSPELVRHGIAR